MQIHIHTRGAYLHIADQMFEIKRKEEGKTIKSYVAAQKITSLWLSPSVAVSTNAVQLAIQHNIDIVFLESNGFPSGRVWHSKLGSTTKIRKRQLEASLGEKALTYTQQWVVDKLNNQAAYLEELAKSRKKYRTYLTEKITKIGNMAAAVLALEANKIDEVAGTIRGLEGTGGRLYFEALSHVLPEQYQFAGRSSRPAEDVFNALLNYVYGITYSRVEKALIIAGLDPYVGFLHRDDYNHKSLVYDFIEPFRCHADKVAFRLCSYKQINQEHWKKVPGGIGLTKPGKVILVSAYNDYFDGQKILYQGRKQSHSAIMQAKAYRTAQELLTGEDGELQFPEIKTI